MNLCKRGPISRLYIAYPYVKKSQTKQLALRDLHSGHLSEKRYAIAQNLISENFIFNLSEAKSIVHCWPKASNITLLRQEHISCLGEFTLIYSDLWENYIGKIVRAEITKCKFNVGSYQEINDKIFRDKLRYFVWLYKLSNAGIGITSINKHFAFLNFIYWKN